jgi:Winged helix DNA-binding domain
MTATEPALDAGDDFDIGRIDEVIHGRVRLGIMAYLSGVESADFSELKAAGFVAVSKSFQGRKPLTRASMTEAGRDAFLAYLDAMSALVAGR